jgi:IS30 family transposase
MEKRKYHLITQEERARIELMFNGGDAVADIAAEIGVHRGTLYREINRGIDWRGRYHADRAQAQSDKPRRRRIGWRRARHEGVKV